MPQPNQRSFLHCVSKVIDEHPILSAITACWIFYMVSSAAGSAWDSVFPPKVLTVGEQRDIAKAIDDVREKDGSMKLTLRPEDIAKLEEMFKQEQPSREEFTRFALDLFRQSAASAEKPAEATAR